MPAENPFFHGVRKDYDPADQPVRPSTKYELLGVTRFSNPDELRDAYRKKAREFHPDNNRDNPEDAATVFRLIQDAYVILRDPITRRAYNTYLDNAHRAAAIVVAAPPCTPRSRRVVTTPEIVMGGVGR